jgi:hypothetical protein
MTFWHPLFPLNHCQILFPEMGEGIQDGNWGCLPNVAHGEIFDLAGQMLQKTQVVFTAFAGTDSLKDILHHAGTHAARDALAAGLPLG